MSQTENPERVPVWPRVLGVLLALVGLVLLIGGIQLVTLGGSWYYLVAGAATVVSGVSLVRGKPMGAVLYLVVVIGTAIWSLAEVGTSFWGLVPRLAPVLVLGLFAALALRTLRSPARAVALPVAGVQALVLVAGAVSVFTPHDTIENTAKKGTEIVNDVPVVTDAHSAENSSKYFGRTADSARFAPFDQINAESVKNLEVAWTYHTGAKTGAGQEDQNTPIQVGDSLYLCTPENKVIALDAESGQEKWVFDPKTKVNGWWSRCRGVAYYDMPAATQAAVVAAVTDSNAPASAAVAAGDAAAPAKCQARIITTDKDARLWALDAKTGEVCQNFGDTGKGYTDLSTGMGEYPDFYYQPTSQPLVAGDLVVVGGWVWDGKKTNQPSGVVRAYSMQTGELAWAWDLAKPETDKLPAAGETYTKGTPNYWSSGAYDAKLNMVYLPLGNATPDFWGAHRTPEMNKYASSVVALNATTGKPVWDFQSVHMDTWDYDVGTPPTLMDLPDGKGGVNQALVMATKTHQLFLLDRTNGKPLAQVEEKAVPTDVQDGDAVASQTQPWSVGMPQVAKQTLAEKDMWGATMFDQLYCRIKFKELHFEGPFTKLTTKPTLVYPGYYGGFNWGGMSFDPRTNMLIVNDMVMTQQAWLEPQETAKAKLEQLKKDDFRNSDWTTHVQEGTPYQALKGAFNSFLGLPCHQPSWGNLTAIDMNTKTIAWQVPLGTVEDARLKGVRAALPVPIGMPTLSGPFSTAGGLTFFAGTMDYYLRAFDNQTGKVVWKSRLPVGAQATPMTYLSPESGRQFVVVSAGGSRMMQERGDAVIAYALPKK